MMISRLFKASLFSFAILGLTALPATLSVTTDGVSVSKAAFAKNDKEKKAKKDEKVKADKDCTRDQPCNDENDKRKDGEKKAKGKDK